MYQYKDGGLKNVWLTNGFKAHKTPYGEAVAIDDVDGLTTAICLALTRKPSKLTGAEFRYLRQGLMLSQPSLGQVLGVTNQAVALWEKTGKVPKMADTTMRLIYTAHAKGNEQVKNIVTALNESERFMVVLSETAKGWRSTTESTETSYLLSNPANAKVLMASVSELKAGKAKRRTLAA
jgi:DNA-binding transcriptional regulator YiaG